MTVINLKKSAKMKDKRYNLGAAKNMETAEESNYVSYDIHVCKIVANMKGENIL